RERLLMQHCLPVAELGLQYDELPLCFFGLPKQPLGLDGVALHAISAGKLLRYVPKLRVGATYSGIQLAAGRFVAAKLVTQPRTLLAVLALKALLVRHIHRPAAGGAGRKLLQLLDAPAQLEHLLFELGIDGALLGCLFAECSDSCL